MSKPISASASEILINERLRVSSILESPEGLARPKAALQLALRTTMDSEAAIDMLKTIPVSNPYIAAMDLEGAVNVNAMGANPSVAGDKKSARIAEIKRNVPSGKRV